MENALLNDLASRGCPIEKLLADTYMGFEDAYVLMLRRLPESTELVRIRAAAEAGDADACFEAAHALKGLYANLGLEPARALCSRIVELVRPRTGTEGVESVLTELEPLHASFVSLIAAE